MHFVTHFTRIKCQNNVLQKKRVNYNKLRFPTKQRKLFFLNNKDSYSGTPIRCPTLYPNTAMGTYRPSLPTRPMKRTCILQSECRNVAVTAACDRKRFCCICATFSDMDAKN